VAWLSPSSLDRDEPTDIRADPEKAENIARLSGRS
jgi:hypothetical protein